MSQTSTSSQIRKTGAVEGSTYYNEILNKVRDAGLLKRAPEYYIGYFAIISGLSLLAWAGVILLGVFFADQPFIQLFALGISVFLGALTAQYAFMGHELAHNQVFEKKKWNEWGGLILSNMFAGLSYGFWLAKHNRHHAKPNMIDGDPDINLRVLAFTTEQKFEKNSTERLLTKNQGWLFPILSFLTAGDLLLDSFKALGRKTGRAANLRWLEGAMLVVRFAVPLVMFFLFLNPIVAFLAWAVYMLSFGALLGNAFAVNHIGMPLIEKGSRMGFFERQVLTSRNIYPGPVMDVMMGGLNYQVEHHLFPSMARPHLKKANKLVKEFCKEKGIPLTEMTFAQGYAQVIRHLDGVAKSTKIDPFMCPMVAQYRPTV